MFLIRLIKIIMMFNLIFMYYQVNQKINLIIQIHQNLLIHLMDLILILVLMLVLINHHIHYD